MRQKQPMMIFLLLWTTYFMCYCLRKPLSIYKYYIESEFHLSQSELGWVDVSLLLPYAMVQIFGANFLNSFRPNIVITLSLLLAAVATQLLVLTQDIYLFCALVVISGAAQAPIWPACIKALSSHIGENSIGTYVGLLDSAPYAGASFSSTFVVYIADRYGWRHSMTLIFVICSVVTFFVFYFVRQNSVPQAERSKINDEANTDSSSSSVMDVLKIDGVSSIALAVFFLKFTRYTLSMWLPMYLTKGLGYSIVEAGWISSAFQFGGVFGSPMVGYIVDRSSIKMLTLAKVMFLPVLALAGIVMFGNQSHAFLVAIQFFLVGFGNCGSDSVINGAITMEYGGKRGTQVTSLVNGLGSLGGLVEGPVVALLVHGNNWNPVILLLLVCSTLPVILFVQIKQKSLKPEFVQESV